MATATLIQLGFDAAWTKFISSVSELTASFCRVGAIQLPRERGRHAETLYRLRQRGRPFSESGIGRLHKVCSGLFRETEKQAAGRVANDDHMVCAIDTRDQARGLPLRRRQAL